MENPTLIPVPFAKNGDKNEIPEKYTTSLESNKATWDEGFRRSTMIPASAGGVPPLGPDFNGILHDISDNIVRLSQGGKYKFSVDYAETIGGYPNGAILQSDDETKEYQSLIDNNKVNFNNASAADLTKSWKQIFSNDILDQINSKQPSGNYATKTELKTVEDKIPTLMTKAELEAGTSVTARSINAALLKGIATEFATSEEAQAQLITGKAIDPAALGSVTATTNRQGLIKIATEADVDIGADSKKAVPCSLLSRAINNSFSKKDLSSSGYQILPGGLIIQWSSGSARTGSLLSFPMAFTNDVFCLTGSDGNGHSVFGYKSITQSGFTLDTSNGTTNISYSYLAIGY